MVGGDRFAVCSDVRVFRDWYCVVDTVYYILNSYKLVVCIALWVVCDVRLIVCDGYCIVGVEYSISSCRYCVLGIDWLVVGRVCLFVDTR